MARSLFGVFAFIALASIYIGSSAFAQAPAGAEARLKVFGHGDLILTVPAGWDKSIRPGSRKLSPPTMTLKAPHDALELLITPLWSTAGDPAFNSPAEVRHAATIAGQQMLSGAVEKALTLQDLKEGKAQGCYYTLTDKAPPKNSFEYMTSAFLGVGDYLVTATILYHQKDSSLQQQAMEVLKALDQADPADPGEAPAPARSRSTSGAKGGKVANKDSSSFTSPDGTFEIVIPGKYKKVSQDYNASGSGVRWMGFDDARGIALSILIEPATSNGDSKAARDYYLSRTQKDPVIKRDVRTREAGTKAILLYQVDEGKEQHMHVYIASAATWIDAHLSKKNFATDDMEAFTSFVNEIRVQPTGKPKQH